MSKVVKNKYHEKYAGKYTLAFDLGVASVGMAAIDENYQPLIYKNQEVFATKLFSEAHNAENRRLARGVRRGYRRRMRRLQLLQELFAPLINPVDDKFFAKDVSNNKWKNSNNFENRTLSEVLVKLNQDPRLTPTIYHLRNDLINSKEAADLRLIYLALHHIIKYRGHFLNSGGISNENIEVKLSDLLPMLDASVSLTAADEEKIMLILEDNSSTKRDKQNKLKVILKPLFIDYPKQVNSLAQLLTDSKFSIKQLFFNLDIEEDIKVNISDEELEEKTSTFDTYIYDTLQHFYNYYLNIQLKHILQNNNYFCESQIDLYDQFKVDLDELKDYIRQEYGDDKYRQFFVTSKANLSKYQEKPEEKLLCLFDQYNKHAAKGEELFKNELLKLLKSDSSEIAESIKLRLENDEYLLKQRSRRNVAVPYQLNLKELEAILQNQKQYHDCIDDELIEKCIQLIKFRIPYAVGPLAKDKTSEWAWSTRKTDEHERVKPWTYKDIIDERQSASDFITRMTNNCTYLVNEPVLPKSSLLVQYYEVLNELNGINYRPKNEVRNRSFRLKDLRYGIIEDLFKVRKNVTIKQLEDWLKENEATLKGHELYGFQKENGFASSMSSWVDFEKILNKRIVIGSNDYKMVEEIILWLTVYNEKTIVEELLKDEYGSRLDDNQIKQILALNYSGWSRMSKELLDGITSNQNSSKTIIEIMMEDEMNFMEVYHSSAHGFEETVQKENNLKVSEKIVYEDIKKLIGSPALKRGVWQVIRMYQEVVELFGEPKIIVLENTRSEEQKRRTVSRADKWKELSKGEKDKFWEGLPVEYQNDKHYLYLLQEGRCMYTNEVLDFSNLNNYHIDHITPQTIIKDNSLDNRVLVKSIENMDKSGDKVPLQIVSDKAKAIATWTRLYEKGYMSSKKFNSLLRTEITEEDRGNFIKRQLVETSQIIKHVTNLLQENVIQQNFDTKVYGLRSKVISDVRRAFNLPKIREIGPQHHAMDAYIAAVVQQFIFEEYGDKLYHQQRYSIEKQKTVSGSDGLIVNKLKKLETLDEVAGEVVQVRDVLEQMMEKKVILTRMTGTNKDGARFWKETRLSPKSASDKNKLNYANAKASKAKYGIPSEVNNDYILLINFVNEKDKLIKRLFSVPYDLSKMYSKDLNQLSKVILERNKVTFKEIVSYRVIRKDQLIDTVNGEVTLTSEAEIANFKQFSPSLTLQRRMKDINYLLEDDDMVKKTYDEFIDQYFNQFKGSIIFETKRISDKENLEDFISETMKINDKIDVIPSVQIINELLIAVQPSNASSTKLGRFGRITRKIDLETSKIINVSVTGLNKMYEDM